MFTVSVPTLPAALDLSPYEIWKLAPGSSLNVLDFDGSKRAWPVV